MTLRLAFMGTPDFAVPTLNAIVAQGHEIAAVYTREPAAAGRGMALKLSPVHQAAALAGLQVRTPVSLRGSEAAAEFAALGLDAAVVVAYGLILPQAILDAPRLGCLNLHGSLLPRWRGAAPMQRAIMAGDAETGVMVMRMEAGLDTGPVSLTERVTIPGDMTAGELHDVLAPLGAGLMVRALAELEDARLRFTPQSEAGVTYATKITKAECRIDWRQPAPSVHNQIRGLSPFPGAFFVADFGRGPERVKVLRSRVAAGQGEPGTVAACEGRLVVSCSGGAVELLRVQRAGKPATAIADFLNGTPIAPGLRLDGN